MNFFVRNFFIISIAFSSVSIKAKEGAEYFESVDLQQNISLVELGEESANRALVNEQQKWILVLKDPRSNRRKNGNGRSYSGAKNYKNDPFLERYSSSVAYQYNLELLDQWPIESLNVHCLVVKSKPHTRIDFSAIKKDKKVEWIQAFQQFELLSDSRNESIGIDGVEIDPYRKLQKNYTSLELDKISPQINGSGVSIAIVDTGIQLNHPDFKKANIKFSNFVLSHQDISLDSNELISDPSIEHHGTGIAGVIAAQPNNGTGIVGVAPKASLHVMRGCWEYTNGKTRCDTLSLSRALEKILQITPHILNLSLTGPKDPLLDRLLDKIIKNGTIVVTAFDEHRKSDARFPSARMGVVTARQSTDKSHLGNDFLSLPGRDVLTLQPTSTYAFMSGNSLSSANLTGILALLKQTKMEVELGEFIANSQLISVERDFLSVCDLLKKSRSEIQCEE